MHQLSLWDDFKSCWSSGRSSTVGVGANPIELPGQWYLCSGAGEPQGWTAAVVGGPIVAQA